MASMTTAEAPTNLPNSTNAEERISLEKSNVCGCVHDGICRLRAGEKSCECPLGWTGERCDETVIDFGFSYSGRQSTFGISNDATVAMAFSCLVIVVLAVGGFIVWRKHSRSRERKRWIEWQQARRQSKATIEGETVIEASPAEKVAAPSFGVQFLKTCNKAFALNYNEESDSKQNTSGSMDKPDCLSTECTDRNITLPEVHKCASVNDQVSIIVHNDHVSFLSSSPGFINPGFFHSELCIESETQQNYKECISTVDQVLNNQPSCSTKPASQVEGLQSETVQTEKV